MLYIFEGYTFDTKRYELSQAGNLIPLRPKVFQMLAYLLAHHDRVVAKNELLEHLWPEQFIGDAALNSCLMAVRKAVGDSGQEQRFIKTLRGRGYRFMANVEVQEDQSLDQESLSISHLVSEEASRPSAPGATLSETSSNADVSGFDAPISEGEYKSVTVLCCALDDALPIAARVGPEAMHRLMQAFFAQVREIVWRYEGTITEFAGDGCTALFGAPIALEDHARRAILTALDIRQYISESTAIQALVPGEALALCVGLHTGPVVVGQLEHDSPQIYTAVGDTTDLANRLLHMASCDTVLISEATYRLVHEEIQVELGVGVCVDTSSTPSSVYAVQGLIPRRAGVPGHGVYPSSEFVGRKRELAMLHERLAYVASGQGQMVGIAGEPGIGKSRLLYEFSRRLNSEAVTYCVGHNLPFGSTTPYRPLREVLCQACGLLSTDSREALMTKVRLCLEEASMLSEEAALLLMQLLEGAAATESLSHLGPQTRRMRTFAVLRQFMLKVSQRQPLVIAIENLHWIDATSEEWLATLVEHLAAMPILLLATYRPGYQPPWLGQSTATQIALPHLLPDDSLVLLRSAQKTVSLSEPLVQAIVVKSAGNPFFLEELTRSVGAADTSHESLPIPDSVQAVLAARIDQLSAPDKWLLQMAAVLGTNVLFRLLDKLVSLDEESLVRSLKRLQTAEFIYESQTVPEVIYTFRHGLTQEVAYQTLLSVTRQKLHEQIARLLTEQFFEIAETQPELVAHHYTEANCIEPAVVYWQRAGQQALNQFAHVEAHRHVTKGLSLLSTHSDPSVGMQHELSLNLMLARVLTVLKGYTDPEVERTHARIAELSQQLGNMPLFFTALHGRWTFYFGRAQHREAREVGERYLQLAQSSHDVAHLLGSHCSLGQSLLYIGEFPAALKHFEQGLSHYDPLRHSSPHSQRSTVHDPRILCLVFKAYAMWVLGYPDRAVAICNDALGIAQELRHPFSQILASWAMAWVHLHRREASKAQERAETTVNLAKQQRAPFWLGQGIFIRGWALAEQECRTKGIEQMRQGCQIYYQTGAEAGRSYYQALMAEIYHEMGDVQESLDLLDDALDVAQRTGEFSFTAELYRLKGEFLLGTIHEVQNVAWTPEAYLQKALAIAREQQAKSLELRAAMSLSRLWQQQGKQTAAYRLLADVYEWFTEGFDTVYLQSAWALLQALRG